MTAESFNECEILILEGLDEEGPMSPKEISNILSIPLRTVTRNLRKLRKRSYARKSRTSKT
jgi:DNA-binding MarR family transcriptional regulator